MGMGTLSRGVATALFLLLPSAQSHAKSCADLFIPNKNEVVQSAAVRALVVADPYEQWLLWEELANKSELVKPSEPVSFEVVRVDRSEVEVWRSAEMPFGFDVDFVNSNSAFVPRHVWNQDLTVPFAERTAESKKLEVRMTASRSTAPVAIRGLTVKTPTDHAHGPGREHEPTKVLTKDDIRDAILRSGHFNEVDRRFAADRILVKMLDVFAIIDKVTRNGVLFRDISRLSNGDYHLPALSIPYVGRAIAEINGVPFAEFWADAYAAVLGRAKARLLLRYGLQMETPNAQNYLVPFNRNLRPLPHIVARDLGFTDRIERDRSAGLRIDSKIIPNWENSKFLFDDAGDKSIDQKTLALWNHAHDMAYKIEIEQALGVTIIKNKGRPSAFRELWIPWTPLSQVQEFLTSPEGQRKLAEFAANSRLP